MNWLKKYWTYPAIILLMVVCSQTLSKAQEFVELKGHPAFEGLADYSNKQWKKCNSIKDYEDVLVRMRKERDKFDNITGAE